MVIIKKKKGKCRRKRKKNFAKMESSRRVSMGLTDRRKTAKNLVDSRKN